MKFDAGEVKMSTDSVWQYFQCEDVLGISSVGVIVKFSILDDTVFIERASLEGKHPYKINGHNQNDILDAAIAKIRDQLTDSLTYDGVF